MFLRAQAPYQALTSVAVTTVVATVVTAAPGSVSSARTGCGIPRATAMLRSGGSLAEVGQALRHARPLTTAIYAKVDYQALRQLAQPWPGEPA